MKSGKSFLMPALLLLLVIAVPVTVFSGFRDNVEVKPADDQPWGGEINVDGNTDASINAISPVLPQPINPEIIRHIGTPWAPFGFIRNLFISFPSVPREQTAVNQTKVRNDAKPASTASLPIIRNTRLSSPKGR